MAKPSGTIITVPSTWTTYIVESDVSAIVGNQQVLPHQIVLEQLVAMGKARRVGTVTTFKAEAEVPEKDDNDDDDEEETPWIDGKE